MKIFKKLTALVLALTLVLGMTTITASAASDNLAIGSVTLTAPTSGKSAAAELKTVTVGGVTRYTYNAKLPSGTATSDLKKLKVVLTGVNSDAAVSIDSQTSATGSTTRTFNNVDVSASSATISVTYGGETRAYELTATVDATKLTVEIGIRTINAFNYGTEFQAAATAIMLPSNDKNSYIKLTMNAGDTVMDALVMAANRFGIQLTGAENNYISKISKGGYTLGEFTCGGMSGWMYTVIPLGGEEFLPMYGAAQYYLEGGEKINWQYTCNYGADIGFGF